MDIISRTRSDFYSNTEIWIVRSPVVGDRFRVCVTGPERAIEDGARLGAVYGLDAGLAAGLHAGTARALGLGRELPPLFVVSVGYEVDSRPDHLVKRTRDLTPTHRAEFDPLIPTMLGLEGIAASGGADAFLDFLVNELRPALADAYPIDPGDATLTGGSLGGLFTLHALTTRAASFQRYLAISPSIWWDDHVVLRAAAAKVAEAAAPSARVYMCAGEFESLAHTTAQFAAYPQEIVAMVPRAMREVDMHGDLFAMEETLKPWVGEGFRVEAHILPEESHTSVSGAALSRGLRRLYAP